MYAKYYSILCTILWVEFSYSQLHSIKQWPLDKNTGTSRASPINVNTLTAIPVKVTPLIRKKVFKERGVLINTGTGLEVRSTQISQSFLTGGVLYNETYIYHSSRFYWTNNSTQQVVQHTINGYGTTLAAEIYYYNKKYNNFNNSLNHFDGLTIISILICLDTGFNPSFNTFQYHLEQIIRPGSQVNTEIGAAYVWYDYLTTTRNYYAYPGSYTDVDRSRIYNCATVLVFPLTTASPSISREQFACSFARLKNNVGKPLTYVTRRYPVAGRPVSSAVGIQEIQIPFERSAKE